MNTSLSAPICRRLEKAARTAATRAYAPYSHFPVGAAILSGSGKIYAGCNIENSSYGLCNCAERTALFTAIAAGERKLKAVALYTPTNRPNTPCGACRQALSEFGPNAFVIAVCDSSERIATTLDALLPSAFALNNSAPNSPRKRT